MFQRTFCPKIPISRRIKKDLSSEERPAKVEKGTAEKKRPNVKKEGRRVIRDVIASESVFSLGPAGKLSQGGILGPQ